MTDFKVGDRVFVFNYTRMDVEEVIIHDVWGDGQLTLINIEEGGAD